MQMRTEKLSSQAGAVSSGGLGVACAISIGMLMISLFTHGINAVAKDATAAPADDGYSAHYFPAQFPAPKGLPESHIEAF